jgi:hypothetical protein
MNIADELNEILASSTCSFEKEVLISAIAIVNSYRAIPEGYIQCIYNPEEYMLVARVK